MKGLDSYDILHLSNLSPLEWHLETSLSDLRDCSGDVFNQGLQRKRVTASHASLGMW